MSRESYPGPRLALVGLTAALAAVSCADRITPLAPRPPHAFGIIGCTGPGGSHPCAPTCADSLSTCDCTSSGRDSSCVVVPLPPIDSAPARLRIITAQGPNPEGSFTTRSGERTLTLAADVSPTTLAGAVAWTVADDPADRVQSAAPSTAPPNGASTSVDLPNQTATRWQLPHGTAWTDKALAFRVVAAVLGAGGAPLRDSLVVRQREVDVLRQEYVDHGIPVPTAADTRTAADVAGVTRFGWAELNQGDYRFAVLTTRLLQKLPELEARAGTPLTLNSVFRNPAHQRFHIPNGAAKLSQHQYGTAVDLATFNDRARWDALKDVSKRAGACVEPLSISKLHHVHADWRPGAPVCPRGW
ncbi:hypothetical protein tb265_05550 [Gemmatimonadetes bacterium T265]|nr:hypothetical protein tb265_05550 [Gemmatimonadetes bacterium T265]